MAERVGVYVCHCGSNIAGTVDVEGVTRWATTLPGVVVAREYKFMCSSLGQALIEDDIKKEGLTRIVIAACSPHLHEKTFRRACGNAGLNPFLLQMANIREHVSWVTKDKQAATTKVKALVAGAVGRVQHHRSLEPMPVTVNPHTLVVGGGLPASRPRWSSPTPAIRCISSSASRASAATWLSTTRPSRRWTAPACILTPKMSEGWAAREHHAADVLRAGGRIAARSATSRARIRRKARYVREDKCTGCGLCIEKCPRKVVDDAFEAGMGYRKAIYTPFPQAVPKIPVIDTHSCIWFERQRCRACEKLCPTGAIDFDQQDEIMEVDVGNIILATGWDLFDCRRIPQYGYGQAGECLHQPRIRADVQCLGSDRRPNRGSATASPSRNPCALCTASAAAISATTRSCSGICCMLSLKLGHLGSGEDRGQGARLLHRYAPEQEGLRGVLPASARRGHALRPRQGGRDH